MKGKKLLVSIIALIAMLGVFLGQSASYATKSETFDVYLKEVKTNSTPNTGYAIGDPYSGGKYIWGLSSNSKNLYCVKGGVGYTWNETAGGKNKPVTYTTGYDLKTEKSAIEGLNSRSEDYSNIAGTYYKQILWITDNMYIPGESTPAERTALLKAAGIDPTDEAYQAFPLTDDDIDSIQQLALWYYTNYGDGAYSYAGTSVDLINNLLNIKNTQTINQNWQTLSTVHANPDQDGYGPIKAEQMDLLFHYFLDSAEANKDKYTETTQSGTTTTDINVPITISEATLSFKTVGSNYLVGPINITKNNDIPYTLDFVVKNGNGATITTTDDSFVDSNGNKIDKNTATQIYIKVPQSTKITVDITINYDTSETTLWVPGTANNEQPIIEVKKLSHDPKVHLTTDATKPFDLALRKFITAINGETVDTRAPQVDVSPLKNGQTTAKYIHSKTPLEVKNGDLVEYTIRVYNEGELDGYAQEISDYILQNQGLEFVEDNSTNTTYRWTKSGDKVVTDYLSYERGTDNLLTAFDQSGTTLDSRDVKIVFKVTEQNSSKNTLVNIAEISKAKDKDGNDLNNEGDDRDSTPAQDKYNYPNNGYNTEIHEDDIDYEPLKLKEFDLALRKFISAVSSDETIDEGDYLKGDQSREPVLNGKWRTDEPTTLVKEHSKTPLSVKSGDYVLYTIRVYNEGDIDGYASLIRDNIPEGLTFVTTDATFNGIWTVQSDGSITTDWLAKGQGDELNSVEGETAYTANLLKALKKNEDGSVTVSTTPGNLNPDYRDVQVLLKVTEPDTSTRTLTNRAQISGATDEKGNPSTDRDSTPDNGYSHNEDDEDFEPVVLKFFDLSLRKFISAVSTDSTISNGEYLTDTGNADGTYTRGPVVDTTTLEDGTTATYNHTKTPVEVKKGSTVVYTIRVYNEGNMDGYASQITDHLPAELEYVEGSSINSRYGWTISADGRTATTNYLAADSYKLAAREVNTGSTNPYLLHCFDVQIECKVKDDATIVSGQKITNIADISEYRDENKQAINPDRDSTSNNVVLPTDTDLPSYKDDEIATGKTYIPGQEDDDDFEKLIIPDEKYDLALRKFITQVNGTAVDTREPVIGTWGLDSGTTTAKAHSKAPVAVSTGDTVRFTIRVYNEGNVQGTATEITDFLPEGLEYIDNEFNRAQEWTADGRTIKTSKLAGETIKAFDGTTPAYKDVQIECKVIATKVNGHNLRNIAAITGDNGEDIDSSPEVNPTNDDNYPTTSNPQGKGQEDDDDFEELRMKAVDFALRKFITSVDGTATTGREPTPDVSKLIPNGTESTAVYNHAKAPLAVRKGSNVIYTIRAYNEGEADGYVGKITDYLPANLEFVENSEVNARYGWKKNENGSYYTEYLAYVDGQTGTTSNMIKAFDGTNLDYKDVQIECKVKDSVKVNNKETNIAEISRYENANGDIVNPDRDSTSSNVKIPEDLPGYKDDEIASGKTYIPGQEDDDDFEKVYVPKFDLALRKFITNINGQEETSRIPQVDATKLISGESTTATYTHPKDPVKIAVDDVVTYTIRVYNEGDVDGYVAEIEDDIPEHLIFLPENTVNKTYGWKMYDEQGNETNDVSKAVQIKSTYLSKENEASEGANLIKAFDKNAEVSDTNPDHKEVKVAFQVSNKAQAKKVITNYAQIYKHTDKDGNPVEDIDSTPGKWIDGEDDQDIENLIPQIFDLGLLKYVTQVQVTEDGKTTTTNTNNVGNHDTDIIPKVEINKKKISTTTVKFIYTIKVINISDVAGNPQEIIDYIPEGLEFIAKDNPQWTVKSDGVVSTDALVNTKLEPGESADVQITLEWINGANNMGLKHNVAQMADKQDYADVLLSIKTGQVQLYIILGASILLVLAGGIFLIKKYVL